MVFPAQVTNKPPVVNAGPSQAITLPALASLMGSVSDDGLPVGAIVVNQWSLVSGPGTVAFANPNLAVTTAGFSQAGTYVLQLSASDTQYTTTSTVTIVVNSAVSTVNQPPALSANPALPAVIGVPLSLNGSAIDDGLPNGTLIVQWSQLGGPGTASFSNTKVAASQVTFSVTGRYVLQLSACDSQYTSILPITITVFAAVPTGTNQPPTVSAGPAISLTLPTNVANLAGVASDDGLATKI